jgi:hypothetical protein
MFLFRLHRLWHIGKFISPICLFLYFFFPVVLFLLPVTYFDTGDSLCISKLFFGIDCYACGMTRAVMRWIHFEPYEALLFNKLSIVVFPLLVYLWAFNFFDEADFFLKSYGFLDAKKGPQNYK